MAPSSIAEQKTLFCRIIDMGRDPQLCMKFMALWMWLESNDQGFEELVHRILFECDALIASVLEEAEAILLLLDLCSSETLSNSSSNLGMKNTLSLAQRFLPVSAVTGDKDKLYRGIVSMYNEVCFVVFKDILEERNIKASLIEEKKGNSAPFKLNPFAKLWTFATQRAPEEERCLFLTFSNGHPLTENQIFWFFQENYGNCVERVYVHWPAKMKRNDTRLENASTNRAFKYLPALFGKVVFNRSSIPAMILCGYSKVKFYVDRKPVWCKKYEPNKKYNHVASNSNSNSNSNSDSGSGSGSDLDSQ